LKEIDYSWKLVMHPIIFSRTPDRSSTKIFFCR
jgi:hypothetical protein